MLQKIGIFPPLDLGIGTVAAGLLRHPGTQQIPVIVGMGVQPGPGGRVENMPDIFHGQGLFEERFTAAAVVDQPAVVGDGIAAGPFQACTADQRQSRRKRPAGIDDDFMAGVQGLVHGRLIFSGHGLAAVQQRIVQICKKNFCILHERFLLPSGNLSFLLG